MSQSNAKTINSECRYHLLSYAVSICSSSVDDMVAKVTHALLRHAVCMPGAWTTELSKNTDQGVIGMTDVFLVLMDPNTCHTDWVSFAHEAATFIVPAFVRLVSRAAIQVGWPVEFSRECIPPLRKAPFFVHAGVNRIVRSLSTLYEHGITFSVYDRTGAFVYSQFLGCALSTTSENEIVVGQMTSIHKRSNAKVAIITSKSGRRQPLLLADSINADVLLGKTVYALTIPTRGKVFRIMVGWLALQSELF